MITHDLQQGSQPWLDFRMEKFTASEAPAMLGVSKYQGRTELLRLKKTKKQESVSDALQAIFNRGHEAEAMAREIAEEIIGDDLYPVTGSLEVDGLPLAASYDGLTMLNDIGWEHKLLNSNLKDSLYHSVIPKQYKPQLEQQLIVSGAEKILFMASDGTRENCYHTWYESEEDIRADVLAGWKQFEKDLAEYEYEAKQEVIVAKEAEALPALSYHVENGVVVHSLNEYLPAIKDRAAAETSRILETEQDFADKDKFNKATKAARSKLKEAVESVQGEFISFSNFALIAAEIDVILQKMQSAGETQVKTEREKKKKAIIAAAETKISDHAFDCDVKLSPMGIAQIYNSGPDFILALKGLRIGSWQNAADEEVARVKIEIDAVMARVLPNLEYLRENAEDFKFLFADAQQLVNQEAEPFQAVVKSRIADHKQVEADKAEALRLIQVQIDDLVKFWADAVDKAMASDKTEEVEKLAEAVEATRYNFNPEMCGDRYKDVMDSHQEAISTLSALKIGLEEAAAEKQQEDQAVIDLANAEMGDERPTEDLLDRHNMPEVSDYDAGIAPTPETNAPAKDPLGFPAGPEEDEPRFQGSDSDEFVTLNVDDEMPIEDSLSIDLGNFIKKWDLCEEAVDDLHQIMANYHIPL